MRRREFITLLSGVAVGWPLAAHAEEPPFSVGMIGNAPYWLHFREATAKTLGLTFPQMLLATDDEVIEQGIGCCGAECLLLAQSGHHDCAEPCPLLGVKRT